MNGIVFGVLVLLITNTLQQPPSFSYRKFPTGPSRVCRGSRAIFTCEIINDGGFLQSNQWMFRNNNTVIMNEANYMFTLNAMGGLADLIVINAYVNTSYTCTTSSASFDPDFIPRNVSLNVTDIPTIQFMGASDNCQNVTTSWMMIDEDCPNVNYSVTLLATDVIPSSAADFITLLEADVIERQDLLQSNSYSFTNSRIATSKGPLLVVINAVNGPEAGNFSFLQVPWPVMMADTIPNVVDVTNETCVTESNVTWNLLDGTPKCGNINYTYTLMSENETKDGITFGTSQHLPDLTEDTSYRFILFGTNRAENITLINGTISTLSREEAIPQITNISSSRITSSMITVIWDSDSPRDCGDVVFDIMISSEKDTDVMERLSPETVTTTTYLFRGLKSSTTYLISVTGVNVVGIGIMKSITLDTLDDCYDCDDCWPIPCVFIIIACILILILMIDCCLFYYIYKKVKSGSEPHPIIVITFVILTAGIGWVLYKYLTKTKGPSKIGMQDTEKTPSPVDEPVAYATTETDKVKLGTGGITYADIDIGKGPAAPGSIFPQDKPTYGQVKPSN